MYAGRSPHEARALVDSDKTDAGSRARVRIEPGTGIPYHELGNRTGAAQRERSSIHAGVAHDVTERLLRDSKQRQARVAGKVEWSVRQVELDLHVRRALHLLGELCKRDGDAGLLYCCRMKAVRQFSQGVGEILDFVPDSIEMVQPHRIEPVPGGAKLVELVLHDDEALNRVVVHFARDAGALLLVRFEEALGVAPVDGDEPALRDDHRDA